MLHDFNRFRLELDVSDHTAQTVVVLFDETVRELLKCSAESLLEVDPEVDESFNLPRAITALIGTSHIFELKSQTYYEHSSFESFTCWKIIQAHGALTCSSTPQTDTGSSGSASPLMKKLSKKRLSKDPTVSTPLKFVEEKKKEKVCHKFQPMEPINEKSVTSNTLHTVFLL